MDDGEVGNAGAGLPDRGALRDAMGMREGGGMGDVPLRTVADDDGHGAEMGMIHQLAKNGEPGEKEAAHQGPGGQ